MHLGSISVSHCMLAKANHTPSASIFANLTYSSHDNTQRSKVSVFRTVCLMHLPRAKVIANNNHMAVNLRPDLFFLGRTLSDTYPFDALMSDREHLVLDLTVDAGALRFALLDEVAIGSIVSTMSWSEA